MTGPVEFSEEPEVNKIVSELAHKMTFDQCFHLAWKIEEYGEDRYYEGLSVGENNG